MFYIYAGTIGRIKYPDGSKRDYQTKKYLVFHPEDRVMSDRGYLAFKRGEYVIEIPSNDVKLKQELYDAIKDALYELSQCQGLDDLEQIRDLADRDDLSTRQALLGAFMIRKYRRCIEDQGLLSEALAMFHD